MDDDLFRDAFGRMNDSLEPPADAGERVAARTTALRRRRRVLTGTAVTTVAVAAISGAAAATSLGGGGGTSPLGPAASVTTSASGEPARDVRCATVVADGDGARPVKDRRSAVELLVQRFAGDRPVQAVVDGFGPSGTLEVRLRSEGGGPVAEMELRRTDDGLELVEIRSCEP